MIVGLTIGGLEQGVNMNLLHTGADGAAAPMPFLQVMAETLKYLEWRSYSGVLITIGHVAFAINFTWMLLQRRAVGATQPTLFRNAPDLEVAR